MLLVTDLERGGTPLRVARLARGLREAGVDVIAGCLAAPGPVSRELDDAGVPTFDCGARRASDFGAIARLARHVATCQPDLIHAFLTHANVAARLVGAWAGIPVVSSTATIEIERRWHRWVERYTAWLDVAHVVTGRALAEHVHEAFGVLRDRIYITPPLIRQPDDPAERQAARAVLGIAPETFALLWVGRLDPVKRVDAIVECAARLPSDAFEFLLAGDGPIRAALEAQASRSGARGVRFLGWRDDVSALFSASDVFVLPSETEGMPNAALEAMAAGVPLIARRIPPLEEIADGGRRAELFDGGADALAAAIRRLRDDAARRRSLADEGRRFAARFYDVAPAVSALIDVYDRVRATCARRDFR
ncbi:MAG: glycosyltransferase [Phycisphaerae bacterium]